MPRTQIVCTIGPSSESSGVLRKMILAGMDVARLNLSHGSHEGHLQKIRRIRELNRSMKRRVRILLDLEGYRIRIGKIPKPIVLEKRKTVRLTPAGSGRSGIPLDYDGPMDAFPAGKPIYIDDGNIILKTLRAGKDGLEAEVVMPGLLKASKGINVPDLKLDFDGLTKKDKLDLEFGIEHRVDLIAQSFVRGARDVLDVRKYIGGRLRAKIISKIENRSGIDRIAQILKVSDGIMVARGDMGVSVPIYEIPMIQKKIIRLSNRARKFVITATQMLESMTEHSRPTRAEVTDVANAILDGTDYVMLSGETAAGLYPVETVKMMDSIIRYTERERPRRK